MSPCVNGHEVHAGDRFCGQCGWAVPAHCPYGHPAQPDQKYCRDCGVPLDGAVLALPAVTRALAQGQPLGVRDVPALPPVAYSPEQPAPAWQDLTQPVEVVSAPPVEERGPSGGWRRGALVAAVVAGILVLGAVGYGSYALAADSDGGGGELSSTATGPLPVAAAPAHARSSSPLTTSVSRAPLSTLPPPTPPSTAPSVAPPTTTGAAGLATFAGNWSGHGGGIRITPDGQGQATFRAYRFCTDDPTPPCDTVSGNGVVAGGHAQFVLTSSGPGATATGRVISSNDQSAFQPDFAMTVTLGPGDVLLVTSSPSAQSVGYCGPRASPGACGA